MDFKFAYDTYQDVRHNLFLYSIPFLIAAGFFTFFRVLPTPNQQAIVRFFELVSNTQPWKGLLGTGVGVVAFAAIAFLLTEIIQIHDQWYDKHIIRWRHQYATDFILPRLILPWSSRTNYRIFEAADANVRQFQERLYYPYVGDRDLKIPKNKLVRFYEAVTVYWLTQLNEIVLLAVSAIIVYYGFRGPADVYYRTTLFNDLVIVIVAFFVNRAWVRSSLVKVRRATEEEIRAILDDDKLKSDLGCRLQLICQDYSIPYAEAQQD
ncbi:MAG: hypothetical protein KGM47_16570 [Acidobacteriota bacterium]|nr:hypothetical protein [Acidobacteriota bacterium]